MNRNKIIAHEIPIKGEIHELINQLQSAIKKGSLKYDTLSGMIVCYSYEPEIVYLNRLKQNALHTIEAIEIRIKEIDSE